MSVSRDSGSVSSSVHHDLDAETEKMARGLTSMKSIKLSAFSKLVQNNHSRNVDMLLSIDAVTSQLKTYLQIFECPNFTEDVELVIRRVSDLDEFFTEWQDHRTTLESSMRVGAMAERAEMVELLDDANEWREKARSVSRATAELRKRGERILARVTEDETIDARFLKLVNAHNTRSQCSTKVHALVQLVLYRTQKLPCGPSVEMYPRSKKLTSPVTLELLAKQREARVRAAFQKMIEDMKTQIEEARKTAHLATDAVDYCLDKCHELSLRLIHHQEVLDDLAEDVRLVDGQAALLAHLTSVVTAMHEAAHDISRLDFCAADRASVLACINFLDFDLGPLPFPPLPSQTCRKRMFSSHARENSSRLNDFLGANSHPHASRDASRHDRKWSPSLSQLTADPEIDTVSSPGLSDAAAHLSTTARSLGAISVEQDK